MIRMHRILDGMICGPWTKVIFATHHPITLNLWDNLTRNVWKHERDALFKVKVAPVYLQTSVFFTSYYFFNMSKYNYDEVMYWARPGQPYFQKYIDTDSCNITFKQKYKAVIL